MFKEVKRLLICNSNMFIPTVLTELLGNPNDDYLVISDIKNITKFFEFMSIPNVEYLEYGWTGGRLGFIRQRNRLKRSLQQYRIGEVVFFHAEWGEAANWLIKKLSKEVPVKYCKIYDSIPAPRSDSWKEVVRIKLQQRVWWGIDVDVLKHSKAFPSLPESFYREVHAETIQMPVDIELVTEAVAEKLGRINLNAENVLLTGTIVADKLAEETIYTGLTNRIIETVGEENIVSKCHPRFKDLYGKEKTLPQVPSFIPGNVLINNYQCFIGYESTLLVEAAVAGKKSISLMHFLQISDEIKQRWVDFFNSRLQGKGVILYPKTMEELKVIIAN